MPKFKVKAHVSVIAKAEIEVFERDAASAMLLAKKMFTQSPQLRRDCVLNNSSDDTHPFDFEPLEATEIK